MDENERELVWVDAATVRSAQPYLLASKEGQGDLEEAAFLRLDRLNGNA